MTEQTVQLLIDSAKEARKKAYSPYSSFSVGAALLTKSGKCYTGANIENASFSPTVCAERVAFFEAIHQGEREFAAIAIVGDDAQNALTAFCPPCGVCRQVMAEFCDKSFEILLFDGKKIKRYTLDQLFPVRFALSDEKDEDTV